MRIKDSTILLTPTLERDSSREEIFQHPRESTRGRGENATSENAPITPNYAALTPLIRRRFADA